MNTLSSPFDDERISAYMDGELSPAQRIEFEAILASSADYRAAVAEWAHLSRSLRALPRESLTGDLTDRVLRQSERVMLTSPRPSEKDVRVSSKTTRRWAWQKVVWPLAGLAASLLVLLVLPDLSSKNEKRIATNAAMGDVKAEEDKASAHKVSDVKAKEDKARALKVSGDSASVTRPLAELNVEEAESPKVAATVEAPQRASMADAFSDAAISTNSPGAMPAEGLAGDASAKDRSETLGGRRDRSEFDDAITAVTAVAVVDISERVLREVLQRHAGVIDQSVQVMKLRVREAVDEGSPAVPPERQRQKVAYEVSEASEATPFQCYTIQSDEVTMRNIIDDVRNQKANFEPVNEPVPSLGQLPDGFRDWFVGAPTTISREGGADSSLLRSDPNAFAAPSQRAKVAGGEAGKRASQKVGDDDRRNTASATRARSATMASDQIRIQLCCPAEPGSLSKEPHHEVTDQPSESKVPADSER